ncbi:MAG: hypothetical protein HQ568_08455 [Calditrichaeota bacterium]|nr:hypothetical protein [Calditrichota bacterium]
MSCPRGKASPDAHTKLRLFADSGGYCQNPSCLEKLFIDTGDNNIHIAEMAHVFSASDRGPRPPKKMTKLERGSYSNLILLCANCHTKIDKAEKDFPDILILEWKQRHKDAILNLFRAVECNSRGEARALIEPILAENNVIVNTYGPLGEEKYNPESELPKLWIRKIRAYILPNNRRLLTLLDANRKFHTGPELETLELFRQHVDDFESKHVGEIDSNGIMFPKEMKNILGELYE